MNVLANYASDSDSEDDSQTREPARNSADDNDDEFVLAALKDLQNFAASVQGEGAGGCESTGISDRRIGNTVQLSVNSVDQATDDDLKFRSFLDEINSIPYTQPDQPHPPSTHSPPSPPPPPPPPPLSPPPEIPSSTPPPPPPPGDSIESSNTEYHDIEATTHSIESVFSRLDHLSLLPSTSMDPKDMKRRLLEFAIRISDWKNGGLDDAYFLGKERAEAMVGHLQAPIAASDQDVHPPFGGIVGAMVKLVQELEQMVAPHGWSCVWDAEDEAYGFQHIRTPSAPSQQSPLEVESPNTPPLTSEGDLIPNVTTTASIAVSKKKKRKQDEEVDPFSDQHIHPSRRAVLTSKGGTPHSSISTAGASKTMPRKLASLLQKWNEKDQEENSEDEEHEDKEARNRRQSSSAITGANSQSLGNDWRDRRLHQR
ncbi:hypothetical protein BGZ70_001038 [Mortierella alpina]|uniref:Uncharacterized protein n=1 Tax=Mortierella alpina TaxID=64518 RepID=A0A9P6IWN4_MORAP|nr:hypothetical protein BGZ70_001038 [Mortierella alpina]